MERSKSGDDTAIERGALEWMNHHLKSKELEIGNLYVDLSDGLKLIYALEV